MRRGPAWSAGLAALAAAAAFSPVLRGGFVNWDDGPILLDNPHIRELSWASLRWMFCEVYRDTYEPLAWLLFALIHALQGLRPAGFHAASLLLHAGNAALCALLLSRLLPMAGLAGPRLAWSALFGALLFALHPLQAEGVAVASSLADLLAASFALASLLAYLESRTAARRRGPLLLLSWALFFSSGLSRWKAVGLPLVLLALDAWPLKRRALREKVPFLLVSAGILLVNAYAKSSADGYRPAPMPGAWAAGLVFYPMKWLFPWDLMPFYRLTDAAGTLGFSAGLSGALASLCLVGVWLWRGRKPALAVAAVVYLAGIGPTLGMAAGGELFAHDRYAYLALLGLPALAAAAAHRFWARPWAAPAAAALLAFLGAASFRQARTWRDSETLWRHVLSLDPGATWAEYRLGLSLVREGREREAVAVFREQRRKSPESGRVNLAGAQSALGVRLYREGRHREALGPLTEALLLDPAAAINHANLGAAYLRLGFWAEAGRHYQTAVSLRPDDPALRVALAQAFLRDGREGDAAAQLAAALGLDPSLAPAREALRSLVKSPSKRR